MPIASERIAGRILFVRGRKVMLDRDLAEIYGVATKALNQAVRRNPERFPDEFMFRLTRRERDEVVTNCDHLHGLRFSRQMPMAFTEHGIAMLSSVLNSPRAVRVNIQIIKAFIRLSRAANFQKDICLRLEEAERTCGRRHRMLLAAVRKLLIPPDEPRRRIGFQPR